MIDEVSQNQPPVIEQPVSQTEAPQPTQPTVPVAPVKKKPGKGLIIGLIALFLAVVGVSGYMVWEKNKQQEPTTTPMAEEQTTPTPTPDPTADWETYTNEEYGFEIKYPANWQEKKPENPSDKTVYIYSDKAYETGGPEKLAYFIYISELENLPDVEITPKALGNYTAYTTTELPSRAGALTYFIVKDNSKYLSFSLTPYIEDSPYEGQDYHIQLFTQILSTFRFLDKQNITQGDSTSSAYEVTLTLKNDGMTPSSEDAYFPLANYLKTLLQLSEEIEMKIAFDTRVGFPWENGGKYNSTYYIAFNNKGGVKLEDSYEDQYISAQIKPAPNLYPYIIQSDYCKLDSDCIIRSDFCTYGSYNYYHGYAEAWGCGPPSDKTGYTFDIYDEIRGCTTDVQIESTKCFANKCTDQNRMVVCKEE